MFTAGEMEARLKSEFGLISAAMHSEETDGDLSHAILGEGQCTLLANVVDAIGYLCEAPPPLAILVPEPTSRV